MKNQILFYETQRFRRPWFLAIILCVNGFFIYAFVSQVMMGHPIANSAMSDVGLSTTILIVVLISILFLTVRLDTLIREDGLYLRFFPFQGRYKKYAWQQLSKIFIRAYNPFLEFGGRGYRITFGKGKAYNVSGNTGLQIIMKDNSKLLIGTLKPLEAEEAINKINRKN